MKHLIKHISVMFVVLVMAFPAMAISLQDAKQQGLVGEMQNGYLGEVVKSAEVSNLVKNVNKKRKQVYISLARKNKLSLEQVSSLAAEKAIKKTVSGHYIQNTHGKWIKK